MAQEIQYKRLLVAPHGIRTGLIDRINHEIANQRDGKPAGIKIKVNSIVDEATSDALYRASWAGVPVDLWVRGTCTIRPGVPGLSENIRVRSILGRFLEHSRIYYFENAGQSEYYIGSADWRARNLRRRVEVVTPVDDPPARAVLRSVLDAQLNDPRAWALRADGVFERLRGEGTGSQEFFLRGGDPAGSANGMGVSASASGSKR
jgi:polyphosphate kinase